MSEHDLYLTPDGATKIRTELEEMRGPRREALAARLHYAVKQGDLAGEIASRSGVKLANLWAMNTGVNLNHLHIGDRIRVRSSVPPPAKLTVIVRDQCERIEPIPPPVQRVSSARMYVGKRVELSPGRSGKRHVKAAAIYENGRKVGSEILEEQILRAPVPRRVAEGIKAR